MGSSPENRLRLDNWQRLENHYETETFTPATTHYLEIAAKADLYLSILHHLWATGELADSPDDAQRVKLRAENEVRANLYSLSRLSNSHLHNVQRICNAVIQQKAIQRKKQAEQDRMIAAKIAKRNAQREANQLAANAANQLKLEEERREKSRERRANAAKKAKFSAQSDMDALVAAAA